jgi:hypothetical protein
MLKNSSYAKKLLSITLATVTIFTFLFWMNGCQKKNSLEEEKSEAQKIEEMKSYIAKQAKTSFVIQNGEILNSYYSDINGNEITDKEFEILATGPGCYVDDPLVTAQQVVIEEQCGTSPTLYNATGHFIISAANAVVYINPANPNSTAVSDKTRGRIQVLSSSGTSLFNQANIWSNLAINTIGADPSVSGNTLYRVTYKAENIPSSAFASGWQVRAYITFFSECEEDLNPYPYNTIAGFNTVGGFSPCDIINKVYVNPGLRAVSGVAFCCCIPTLYSNRHDVEIYEATATPGLSTPLWTKRFPSTETRFVPTASGLPEGYVTPGQTVKIRYRNVQVNTSTGALICEGQWLANPETWVW